MRCSFVCLILWSWGWPDRGCNVLQSILYVYDKTRELVALSMRHTSCSQHYAIKQSQFYSKNLKASLTCRTMHEMLTLSRQCNEPSSSSNPQSDITSKEHFKILLRILSTILQNYFPISLTWISFICVQWDSHILSLQTSWLSKLSVISLSITTCEVSPTSPISFCT